MPDWKHPPSDFRYILFERTKPAQDECRYYYIGFQPTLFHPQAVVRFYGLKGETQRMVPPVPFASLAEAWPLIRTLIRRRLRHGYQIVMPAAYRHKSSRENITLLSGRDPVSDRGQSDHDVRLDIAA